jgi:transcriptional regulator with XRE-family HTH domain
MAERTELGEFLQARRGRIRPEDLGIRAYGRRRVRGLRREELAAAAGVSVDYYVRLEQGRALNPSDDVLDAIAGVLELDETERVHLHRLGHPGRRRRRTFGITEVVRPGIARLLAGVDCLPAYVLGQRLDILAWTRTGSALAGDLAALPAEQRNFARLVFFGADTKALLADWERVAYETAGLLRLAAGRNPNDPGIAALVDELTLEHEEFRLWWADHEVAQMTCGTRSFRHPVVGDLTLAYEALVLPDNSSQMLVIYTAEPGSRDADALDRLADLAASEPRRAADPQPSRR